MQTGAIEVSQSAREDIRDRMDKLETALDKWRKSPLGQDDGRLKFEIVLAASSLQGYLQGYGF